VRRSQRNGYMAGKRIGGPATRITHDEMASDRRCGHYLRGIREAKEI
jgi:hypothetical protein